MKFNANMLMKSKPGFSLSGNLNPIGIDFGIDGRFKAVIGKIGLNAGEIPLKMTIPFLKRRKGPVLIGSIGPFSAHVHPVEIAALDASGRIHGTLGQKGISGEAKGAIDCVTEMDVEGTTQGKTGTMTFELGSEEQTITHRQSKE